MKALSPLVPAALVFPIGVLIIKSPMQKFLWSTVGLLALLKIGSVVRNYQRGAPLPTGVGWLGYLLLWPGMRPESFAREARPQESVARDFVEGFSFFICGVIAQLLLVLTWTSLPDMIRLYLGLFSFLLMVHFGFSALLFTCFRLLGWNVERLFRSPFRSASLREFWGQRWNLAFVDMNKRIFLPLFSTQSQTLTAFGIFLASGLLHELAISYPAGAGWGGPLLYFLLHGSLTLIEPSLSFLDRSLLVKRLWVWVSLLAPVPLLFHTPFLRAFIQPYFEMANGLASSLSVEVLLYWAVLACGAGHLLILVASFQVPGKLGWRTEFARLGRFNQKIFWTYGGYIVFCIVAFALVDLLNAKGLMDRHPSSVAIAMFIALFWSIRVIVDFGYFKHDDWPKGDQFVIGHTCLTALFCCLALTHWGLVAWNLTQKS